jgi:hypothetical protein
MQIPSIEQLDWAALAVPLTLTEHVGEVALYSEVGHVSALDAEIISARQVMPGLPMESRYWDLTARGIEMLFDGMVNIPLDEEP